MQSFGAKYCVPGNGDLETLWFVKEPGVETVAGSLFSLGRCLSGCSAGDVGFVLTAER